MKCIKKQLYFISIFSLFGISKAAEVTPSFIQPCEHLTQECLTKSAKLALPNFIQGVPDLGITPLDPFIINKLDLLLPGDLKISYRKGNVTGFKNCEVNFVRITAGNQLEMRVHCNITIKGKYKTSGQFLMFTIDGDGDCIIRAKNLNINLSAELRSIVGADGEKYLNIKSFETKVGYDGRVSYNFTNIIKGRDDLSKALLVFMNENYQFIAEEFGKPIVDFGIENVMKNIKQLFKVVPLSALIKANVNF